MPGFDFEKLTAGLSEHQELAEQRRKLEAVEADKQRRIREQSSNMTNEYANSLGFLKETIQQNRIAAGQERQLSGGNIFDQISLEGLKILQPEKFDRQKRTARLAEDMQMAGALGQILDSNQAVLQAQLLASTARIGQAKTIELLSLERLKSFSEMAEIAKGNFEASEIMTDLATKGMDTKAFDAAIQQAGMNNGVVNIGGIDITADRLKTLRSDRSEVEFLREYRGVLRERQMFDAQEAVKNIPGERAVNDVNRKPENIAAAQVIQQEIINNKIRELDRGAQQRQLSHMSVERISEIRGNQYIDPEDESKFDSTLVDEAYTRAMGARKDKVTLEVTKEIFKNYDVESLVKESQRVDALQSRYPAASPLSQASRKYKQAMAAMSNHIGPDRPVVDRSVATMMLDEARNQFDLEIEKEVKRQSSDANMQEVFRAYYRGDPIPTANLMVAVDDRLRASKSLADILPPDMAAKTQKYYNQLVMEKKALGVGSISAPDDKVLRSEAATEALNRVIEEESGKAANSAVLDQIKFPGHPLADLGRERFGSILINADDKGFQSWVKDNRLSPEDGAKIKHGVMVDTIDPAMQEDMRRQLTLAENSALLLELEAFRKGAANEMVEWWGAHGAEYIGNLSPATRAGNSITDGVVNSLVKQGVGEQLKRYSMGLYEADSTVKYEQAKKYSDMITFGNSPESSQIIMLELDRELDDSSKARIFQEVIKPVLSQAQAKGLNFEDTNALVENTLLNPPTELDAGLTSILKTLKRNRPGVIDGLGKMKKWGMWMYEEDMAPGYLDWYKGTTRLQQGYRKSGTHPFGL